MSAWKRRSRRTRRIERGRWRWSGPQGSHRAHRPSGHSRESGISVSCGEAANSANPRLSVAQSHRSMGHRPFLQRPMMADFLGDWGELSLALCLFLLTHAVPARPALRQSLVAIRPRPGAGTLGRLAGAALLYAALVLSHRLIAGAPVPFQAPQNAGGTLPRPPTCAPNRLGRAGGRQTRGELPCRLTVHWSRNSGCSTS